MDSSALISRLRTPTMPLMAILRHDLGGLAASWLVRLWLAGSAVLALLVMTSNWAVLPTPTLVASLLFPYLIFPWSLVVMVLSVSPVSGSRAEAVADGFLSRPLTRYEYLLGSWAARVLLIVGVFLVVMVPMVAIVSLADRPARPEPVTWYGVTAALGVVALVLTFLVSMGFFLGTVLRNQWLAVVVLVFLWFPVNMILNMFSLEEFSPISLTRALPELLQRSWGQPEAAAPEQAPDLAAIARQASNFFELFGGGGQEPKPKPARPQAFFDRQQFQDFSLGRVLAGYSIPTVAAVALATLCFCLRDL